MAFQKRFQLGLSEIKSIKGFSPKTSLYRSDTVNPRPKSFIGKVFSFELQHEAIVTSFDVWGNDKQIWEENFELSEKFELTVF